jgi:nucleoside-diphosphate-sugar epimerase
MIIQKPAVLGATGATGKAIARELATRGLVTRVVSRNRTKLEAAFGKSGEFEIHELDLSDPEAAARAVDSCDVVFHCVGLPVQRFRDHLAISRTVLGAARKAEARPVLITSYWSYGPVTSNPVTEAAPRRPASEMERIRYEQETLFRDSGAAVCLLPDFYGPEADVTFLNPALQAICRGKKANWIGDLDKPRQFIFVPDAAFPAVELAGRSEAYGESWNVAPSEPMNPRDLLGLAALQCHTQVKVRNAGKLMLAVLGLFSSQMRAIRELYPLYANAPILDQSKLVNLIGRYPATSFPDGIRQALRWLSSS